MCAKRREVFLEFLVLLSSSLLVLAAVILVARLAAGRARARLERAELQESVSELHDTNNKQTTRYDEHTPAQPCFLCASVVVLC